MNSIETSRKNPICFDNSFVQLGEKFYAKLNPTPVEQPEVVKLNEELAKNWVLTWKCLIWKIGYQYFPEIEYYRVLSL